MNRDTQNRSKRMDRSAMQRLRDCASASLLAHRTDCAVQQAMERAGWKPLTGVGSGLCRVVWRMQTPGDLELLVAYTNERVRFSDVDRSTGLVLASMCMACAPQDPIAAAVACLRDVACAVQRQWGDALERVTWLHTGFSFGGHVAVASALAWTRADRPGKVVAFDSPGSHEAHWDRHHALYQAASPDTLAVDHVFTAPHWVNSWGRHVGHRWSLQPEADLRALGMFHWTCDLKVFHDVSTWHSALQATALHHRIEAIHAALHASQVLHPMSAWPQVEGGFEMGVYPGESVGARYPNFGETFLSHLAWGMVLFHQSEHIGFVDWVWDRTVEPATRRGAVKLSARVTLSSVLDCWRAWVQAQSCPVDG